MQRQIITIDETKCTGCGECIPGCPEGALQVIDGKARLVSDLFCDGLGACIGHCPTGAMKIESREAEPYDEKRVMHESIVKGGPNVIAAHLSHLIEHNEQGYLQQALEYLKEQGIANPLHSSSAHASHHHGAHGGGCPGSKMMDFRDSGASSNVAAAHSAASPESALRQWPIQLHLVSPQAPYFQGSDLLLAADCAAFAVGDFHAKFMSGKSLAIACPKLDSEMDIYVDKLAAMIDLSHINTITVVIMEVPCCGGLMSIVAEAQKKASRKVPVKKVVISLKGETMKEEWV
ncbi:ATP-binding protein [Chlorobium ferrooxidans]|uniref:4Fe-4S ferredoxin, iron-sulfur binding n=1 Tax=Chlorobium ferrooxidans DSM 13031 TaxID=377431 RepID=Q0YTR1_9CHLB|nr:4Fe-4S binding protein [Chlorobium ferrooxidans]EAT59839.1 4Fe-4S ferredoxin, iron-sulfur binding [Chlorobium ferrooxidans DSM 13031]